ncbi:MAG: hypothetical protein H0T43_07370 [Solirubrobacterales bacterium]|nr:hypothetical protein [Solirubrobacterales bacterium]
MSPTVPDPELDAVTSAFLSAGARFVVIGGFAVIAHRYVRATEDVDLLIPADDDNDRRCGAALVALNAVWTLDGRALDPPALTGRAHSRLLTSRGLVDLLREGEAPLDYATVAAGAERADLGDGTFLIAGLRSLVSFKRLADRPRDRLDLEELRALHGGLPMESLPGLDA